MRDTIIDYIKRNRVSTTEVADCLGKSGALPNVAAVNRGYFRVGKIRYAYAVNQSNWPIHERVIDTKENDVVFIDSINCGGRAMIGELVSKYILLYRQAAAIVTNAPMRDAAALMRENYPIWCNGFNPNGCFNTDPGDVSGETAITKGMEYYEGAIAVCDDCGVVIIPKEYHNEAFYQKLINIEKQEDIWFDRLDHFKENTFEIVCQKNYLNDEEYMKKY